MPGSGGDARASHKRTKAGNSLELIALWRSLLQRTDMANVMAVSIALMFHGQKGFAMDEDDLPPKPANDSANNDTSFGGALGMTFAGLAWVAVFTVIAAAILWMVVHWLH